LDEHDDGVGRQQVPDRLQRRRRVLRLGRHQQVAHRAAVPAPGAARHLCTQLHPLHRALLRVLEGDRAASCRKRLQPGLAAQEERDLVAGLCQVARQQRADRARPQEVQAVAVHGGALRGQGPSGIVARRGAMGWGSSDGPGMKKSSAARSI
jgi:hypothetical protein